MSLISKDLQGKTRGAILFVIWGTGVSVAKVEARRDVAGGLTRVRSRRSESWLWRIRKNWAGLKRSRRCRFSLAIWMYACKPDSERLLAPGHPIERIFTCHSGAVLAAEKKLPLLASNKTNS